MARQKYSEFFAIREESGEVFVSLRVHRGGIRLFRVIEFAQLLSFLEELGFDEVAQVLRSLESGGLFYRPPRELRGGPIYTALARRLARALNEAQELGLVVQEAAY